jgi:5-methylcytosine-specific restriction endonuclease McrA
MVIKLTINIVMSGVLVLNSDANPVSLLPLSVISWEESIKYMVLEKAYVLEWYDDWIVHSEKWETRVPAVIMLIEYMKIKTTIRFSKQNVFLRDGYRCVYCENRVDRKTATLDHVLPVSHGGKTTFENTVTACADCNSKKGNDRKIVPKFKPFKPSYYQLVDRRKKQPFDLQHPSWMLYLGLDQ